MAMIRGEADMGLVAGHLSVAELEARYEACEDVTSSRHFQAIFLLAKGHSTRETAQITSFGQRWIEQLLERYNAVGPAALGDLRRENGSQARVLKPQLLERLRGRLDEPPPDGGRWTSGKVARWMADELGLAKLAPQRGWEALKALGWSIQKPRPRNPKAATPAEQEAFKKKSPKSSPKRRKPIRAFPSKPLRQTNTGLA
jgi:transposase